jgi:uncharacterized protein (TIRG00374 family)
MNNKNSKKKMIISAAAFIAVVVGVFAYIFKGYDFNTLIATVMGADPVYLVLGALGMCCFICCESLSISSGILVFLFIALFCPGLADHLGNKIKAFLIRINKNKAAEGVADQIEEYRRGSEYIKTHKSLLLKTVATTLVQMLALYSITYFVYCALGGAAVGWFTMMTLQAVLTAGVSVVPLPGGTGAGEGGFKLMFAQIFLGNLLMPGMLISRGLSFYLGMILSGIFILIAMIGKSRHGLFFSCIFKPLLTASL